MEADMRKILVALLLAVLMTPASALAEIRITNESLRLPALPPAARQQPPPQRGWPGRHPVLFGALVGLGAGLAVEAVVIPGRSGGEPHSAYIPMFAGVGAGIGSLVGFIVSAVRRPNPQSPGPNP
jgi:hypothetical protein